MIWARPGEHTWNGTRAWSSMWDLETISFYLFPLYFFLLHSVTYTSLQSGLRCFRDCSQTSVIPTRPTRRPKLTTANCSGHQTMYILRARQSHSIKVQLYTVTKTTHSGKIITTPGRSTSKNDSCCGGAEVTRLLFWILGVFSQALQNLTGFIHGLCSDRPPQQHLVQCACMCSEGSCCNKLQHSWAPEIPGVLNMFDFKLTCGYCMSETYSWHLGCPMSRDKLKPLFPFAFGFWDKVSLYSLG